MTRALALFAVLGAALAACDPDPLAQTCDTDCERTGRVVSVEFFGGLCQYGACSSTLGFDDADGVAYAWTTVDGETPVQHNATATLTEDGLVAFAEAEQAIGEAELDAVYGCPGCDDGGAIRLSLWGVVTRDLQVSEWEAGAPPAEAERLEELAGRLQAQLLDCAGPAAGEVALVAGCAQE